MAAVQVVSVAAFTEPSLTDLGSVVSPPVLSFPADLHRGFGALAVHWQTWHPPPGRKWMGWCLPQGRPGMFSAMLHRQSNQRRRSSQHSSRS